MKQASRKGSLVGIAELEEKRGRNLRQLLLRASRIVNRDVVNGLHARGHTDLRSAHTTLLSNMDLAGSTVTAAADRAGITKQAMGRLATELECAGYLHLTDHPKDARSRVLHLTESGEILMLDSFEVMAELEQKYGSLIGAERLKAISDGLTAFIKENDGPFG